MQRFRLAARCAGANPDDAGIAFAEAEAHRALPSCRLCRLIRVFQRPTQSASGSDRDKDRAILGRVYQTSVTPLLVSDALRRYAGTIDAFFLSEKSGEKLRSKKT